MTVTSFSPYSNSAGPGGCAPRARGPLDLSVDLLDPDLDQVRDDTRVRRDLVVPDVGHDDCAVGVGLQLRATRLSDPEPLREVEDLCQPVQRSPDVGEDQHRNDGGGGMERFRFIPPR